MHLPNTWSYFNINKFPTSMIVVEILGQPIFLNPPKKDL